MRKRSRRGISLRWEAMLGCLLSSGGLSGVPPSDPAGRGSLRKDTSFCFHFVGVYVFHSSRNLSNHVLEDGFLHRSLFLEGDKGHWHPYAHSQD